MMSLCSLPHVQNPPTIRTQHTWKTVCVETHEADVLPWRLVIKVRCLALQSRMVTASTTNQNSNSSMVTLKSGEQIPRTCSFVETGEGFTEQHWYNCYTCGLLWDKVCSSSIALQRLLFMFHVFSITLSSIYSSGMLFVMCQSLPQGS